MAISLSKGARVNLSKETPGLKNVRVGLGWDVNQADTGGDFDLDVSAFLVDSNGKCPTEKHFVYFKNTDSPCGAVHHHGDNRTGEGEGDDEKIDVKLDKVDPKIERIVFIVTIYDANARKQNFGQVRNPYIRIVDLDTNKELAKYELDEDFSTETGVNFGELYRKDGSWRFKAVGDGYKKELADFVKDFGINPE